PSLGRRSRGGRLPGLPAEVTAPMPERRRCHSGALDSLRGDEADTCTGPGPRRQTAAARRALTGLPGIFRAARREFLHTTGQPTNAVYGFTAMLINVLRDEQPTH